MKRLSEAILRIMRGLFIAVSRFPLTVICLGAATGLIWYMISLHQEPELIIQKLMFTFLLGAFMGIVAQFSCERFERLGKLRLVVYGFSALLTLAYYLILAPADSISMEVQIRTAVAVFAMFCAFLWLPSYQGKFDFNRIALIHLKAAFTSVLYSAVLSAGCASIIASIDILLFDVNNDTYGYMMSFIWVLFATIYYLSLLPRFHSVDEADQENAEHMGQYPKFLEILVSYIAIPLLTVYTLVLFAYFAKILFTLDWPSGQLGGMVLAYSAAGLTVYVLASLLENHFATWYRAIFPKVLIPVVIMQLISVAIRLNAYGITESRYYVTLFGIFSMACAILLCFKSVSKNGIIALLAAGFAIFSVIPPVDAFTVSRVSQISRLENLLMAEGILTDGKIKPKADVPLEIRTESVNILSYLDQRDYMKYIKWLPKDFEIHDKMKSTFGFEPAYTDNNAKNFYASLDTQKPFKISGYDIGVSSFANTNMEKGNLTPIDFQVGQVKYQLVLKPISAKDVRVSVKTVEGREVVGTNLYDFAKNLSGTTNMPKESLSPEKMTFDVEKDGYKLRIIFQNANLYYGGGADEDFTYDYSLFILFGAPAAASTTL